MLIVDDLLVRPFFSLLDILHSMTLRELYDTEALRDELKENELLYEIGERSRAEYEAERERIESELEAAEELEEQISGRIEVKA
jgi:predicted nuclease with TOPRIM domain